MLLKNIQQNSGLSSLPKKFEKYDFFFFFFFFFFFWTLQYGIAILTNRYKILVFFPWTQLTQSNHLSCSDDHECQPFVSLVRLTGTQTCLMMLEWIWLNIVFFLLFSIRHTTLRCVGDCYFCVNVRLCVHAYACVMCGFIFLFLLMRC